jgi:murein tripeptide amidase MpaA
MRRIPGLAVALFLMSLTCASAQPPLQTPAAHLGYRLCERYTPHHQIVSYFRHVAAAAPTRVSLQEYGKTYEGRPLMLAFVSSPANLGNLEAIRTNNLRLTGLLKDGNAPREDMPVIVWLSYNVNGNEPSSSEAAMKTIHRMLDGSDPATAAWLEKAVVVIDPCINPDGRDRYANWQNSTASMIPDANPQTREHREPWPGGRTNHYYFDLNRDWAWQSQVETQQRMKVYNQWLPQVHVDFHEQSPNSPYYFAPAAQPYHEAITPWQREFQQVVGKNNARYFDRNGWLYFTKERFDLFYPS